MAKAGSIFPPTFHSSQSLTESSSCQDDYLMSRYWILAAKDIRIKYWSNNFCQNSLANMCFKFILLSQAPSQALPPHLLQEDQLAMAVAMVSS